jgi:hypothetical protein
VCPYLLALSGEDGGGELGVGMASAAKVADDCFHVKGRRAVGDSYGTSVVLKKKPAGDAAGGGKSGTAGIEGADAINETIGREMSMAADDDIGTASGKQGPELLIGDAGLDPFAVVG